MGKNPKSPGYNQGKDQGEKLKYIFNVDSFHHHRRFWPTSIRYLPVNSAALSLRYTRCRSTHPISVQWWARVAAHCWFNVGQLCTTLAQHHSNTERMSLLHQVYSNHWTANQCSFDVDPTCLTMAQQQPSILYTYVTLRQLL